MNRISHKQAVKWIDRRLDGLLTKKQLLVLDEHLRSCDACRLYAAEMESLPVQLQNEFRARWDEEPGPTHKVMQHVTAKARSIPMTTHISSSAKLLAGAAALIVLGIAINFIVSQLKSATITAAGTETVLPSPQTQDRLLAFASDRSGNSDIYTMNANGRGLTNLTNNPAYDGTPFWSPDGKQIAFISDRSGSPQIYLVDADGSNVTQLTNGESKSIFDINGFSPWSPDGTKLVYVNKHSEDPSWKLYAMNVKEKTSTALTSEPGAYLLPAWSPDGEHIVFSYYESEARPLARHLFVVDQNGSNLTELTKSLRIDETATFLNLDYFWSPDGTSVFFTAGGTQETTVYKASLDGSLTVVAKTDRFMLDWWEGTTLQQEQNVRTLTWLRADGSRSTLDICEGNRQISSDQIVGIAYQRSEAGSLVVGSNCSARDGWLFYWANPDGTITNQLLSSPISSDEGNIFNMTWSPDDRFLAFVATGWDTSNATHTLYVLDVEQARKDPSVQPLKIEASYNPSWQPVP